MPDFAALASLDLSRLPAPAVVEALDYETMREAHLADFQGRWDEYDALVESDPAVKQLEVSAYREMLLRGRINDAARARMLACAVRSDLDHIGTDRGVTRLVITPATDTAAAVMESDDAYRRRIRLYPGPFSAGSIEAWLYHALTADPRVLDADVWSPAGGSVTVAIQSREGDGSAAPDLVDAVRAYLAQPHIKPLTDVLTVRSVVNVPYTIDVSAFVLPGPSPQLIQTEIVAALQAMAAARRTPSRDVPRSAVFAGASLGPVDKVLVNAPPVDVARDRGEVGICVGITAEVTTYAG